MLSRREVRVCLTGFAFALFALFALCALVREARAYPAAGDRLFPATILLPQISPGDEFYTNVITLPQTPAGIGTPNRNTTFSEVYAKTITDRFGLYVEEDYTRLDRVKAGTLSGWQNLAVSAKYLAVLDMPREFLLTLGLAREFGDTGARRVGASPSGATAPQVFFRQRSRRSRSWVSAAIGGHRLRLIRRGRFAPAPRSRARRAHGAVFDPLFAIEGAELRPARHCPRPDPDDRIRVFGADREELRGSDHGAVRPRSQLCRRGLRNC